MSFQPTSPLRVEPRLKSPPRIREIVWCDFPKDAHKGEMWKRRPVVVLSPNARLYGTATIVPITSKQPTYDNNKFKLDDELLGCECWAICDMITTVSVSRLLPNKGGHVRVAAEEFNALLAVVLDHLPKVLPSEELENDDEDEPLTAPSP